MERSTRTAILDATEKLIKRFGSSGISYQHISEAVAIRKPSVHHHFPTKNDLLIAVIQRECDQFFTGLDQIVGSHKSAGEKLKAYIKLFEKTFSDGRGSHICLFGMMGAELAQLDESVATRIRGFVRDNVKSLEAILEEGRSDGSISFRGGNKASANLIFSSLEGAMVVVRAQGKKSASYQAIARQLEQLFINAD